MTATRDEMIGATVLGRYRIVARLARGGMGVVYLARAEGAAGFAKPVVVKRVLPDLNDDARAERLFVREAHILANLQHPNIVSVIDFGEEDGAYIMVLDYVRAYDLDGWWSHQQANGERVPVDGTIHIVLKVLEALEYAHTLASPDGTLLDIVHADISPGNILVDTDGQVKLLDFGIARMRGQVTKTTDSKSIRGKFAYLPIEALDGSPPAVATDVYACGVVLYELLAGENPFIGSDETRTIAKVISHEPPPISQVRTDVPAELDEIVARAIAKDRTKRFASAKEFARALRRVQSTPDDEATSALAVLAKRDYAAMPSKPGRALSDFEDAWRNPPPPPESRRDVAARVAAAGTTDEEANPFAPTSIDGSPPVASREPGARKDGPRKRTGTIVAVAVGVVGVMGVASGIAFYSGRRTEPPPPSFVVIDRNAPSGSVTAVPASTLSAVAPVAPVAMPEPSGEAVAVPGSSSARPAKPTPAGDPLSAALAKNQPAIEACFQNNASSVTGTPEVSVRFTIDREGSVQKAELSPAPLAAAPLGQCILGIARRTHFPAQSGPASFRIPLRARKVP